MQRWIVKRSFDLKFGDTMAAECPSCPGVYLYKDAQGVIVYVGKAKNLRRRIAQYRNARRMRKLEKTRKILKAAHTIEIRTVETELEAELLEAQLIQELRPRLNVQGAFSFMYPLIGVGWDAGGRIALVRTTSMPVAPLSAEHEWSWHGAYRSRFWVREAFDAMVDLLTYLGHRDRPGRGKRQPKIKFGTRVGLRGLDPALKPEIERFLRGESKALLEQLALELLEKPSARRDGAQIEEHLKTLAAFYRHETRKLRDAIQRTAHASYPVAQSDREALMIRARAAKKVRASELRPPVPSL